MNSLIKKGFPAFLISFILLFIGVRFILGNEVILKNIMAFTIFSLLVGILTSLLIFFKLKIAYLCFWAGLALGFFIMYRTFLGDSSGWEDLIGIISLFTWSLMGLGLGLLGQFGYYLFRKYGKMS